MTHIEAMKLALEYLEESDNYLGSLDHSKPIAALCQAIEQAEKQDRDEYERGFIDGMQKQMQSSVDKAVNAMGKQMQAMQEGKDFTISKPWVGLTQQDIDIAFDDTQEGGGFNEFARAIEQTLRSKNT